MSHRVFRPSLVERDLAEAADFLGRVNADVGLRFLDAAEEAIRLLVDTPEMAGRWESANPRLADVRVGPIRGFENFLIFFRPALDGIALIRILHGARDIERILGSKEG